MQELIQQASKAATAMKELEALYAKFVQAALTQLEARAGQYGGCQLWHHLLCAGPQNISHTARGGLARAHSGT